MSLLLIFSMFYSQGFRTDRYKLNVKQHVRTTYGNLIQYILLLRLRQSQQLWINHSEWKKSWQETGETKRMCELWCQRLHGFIMRNVQHSIKPEQVLSLCPCCVVFIPLFIDSSLFQGLPGGKGERGERVSGSVYAKQEIMSWFLVRSV